MLRHPKRRWLEDRRAHPCWRPATIQNNPAVVTGHLARHLVGGVTTGLERCRSVAAWGRRGLERQIMKGLTVSVRTKEMHMLTTPRHSPRQVDGRRVVAVRLSLKNGAVALLAVVALALTAWPAAAHDVLVATEPADGTVVDAPTEVVLTFSADQLAVGTAVTVTGPDGGPWVEGEPTVSGPSVIQPLRGDMPAGEYAVGWRSVSGDGHPVDGAFTFTIESGSEDAPTSTPTPTPTQLDSSETPATLEPTPPATNDTASSDTDEGDSGTGSPWLPIALGGLAVLGGVTGVVLYGRHRAHRAETDQ